MNLPFDEAHDIHWGSGWLLFPWFGGWVALRDKTRRVCAYGLDGEPLIHGFGIKLFKTFHNCRIHGR